VGCLSGPIRGLPVWIILIKTVFIFMVVFVFVFTLVFCVLIVIVIQIIIEMIEGRIISGAVKN
jgi:hypothetical protein